MRKNWTMGNAEFRYKRVYYRETIPFTSKSRLADARPPNNELFRSFYILLWNGSTFQLHIRTWDKEALCCITQQLIFYDTYYFYSVRLKHFYKNKGIGLKWTIDLKYIDDYKYMNIGDKLGYGKRKTNRNKFAIIS